MRHHRRGSLLIIVTGITSVLLMLSIAFLVRMRSDSEDGLVLINEAQARVLLVAGLSYVQEASRLGWHRSDFTIPSGETDGSVKLEAYGWIDVRDGGIGPRDHYGRKLWTDASAFPEPGGAPARCPLYVMERPPSAIAPVVVPNPVRRPAGTATAAWAQAINLSVPSPQPVEADTALPLGARFQRWREGDPRPRAGTAGLGWLRIYRLTPADCAAHQTVDGRPAPIHWSPAVFLLSIGTGATQGYRDWAEVVASGEQAAFAGDPALFADMRSRELLRWYLCEWSPGQGQDTINRYRENWNLGVSNFLTHTPINAPVWHGEGNRAASFHYGGSILWVERLAREPLWCARW